MDGAEDEVVAKFCGVTTATPEQAKFFLESTEGHLEPALQLYFESEQGRATPMNFADYDLAEDESMGMSESEVVLPTEAMLQQRGTGLNISTSWDRPVVPLAPDDPPQRQMGSFGHGPRNSKGKEKGNGRRSTSSRGLVTTLGDLGKQSDSDSDSDAREYYTGGEKSGMVVQDPNKKHVHRDVEAIFERVRSLGAHEGPAAEPPARPAGQAGGNRFFSGSSHTLTGETRGQQEQVNEDQPELLRASPPNPIVHNIHFWRNGFTVNEGPLRRLDDPANLPFLEARYVWFHNYITMT